MYQGRFISLVRLFAVAGILSIAFTAHAQTDAPAVPGEYLVQFKDSPSPWFANAQGFGFHWETMRMVDGPLRVYKVTVNALVRSDFVLETFRADPNVNLAEPNYIYQIVRLPNDPKLDELWGLINSGKKSGRVGVDVGAEAAWDISTGSDKVVVAVIDTGVDYTHPDLQGNIWINEAEANGQPDVDDDGNGFVDDVYGYDFVNEDGDPMDDHGHGTHCSGTIGARGDDGVGIVGVAWNVKIMGLKFLGASGSGTLEGAVRAIRYATEKNVDIMSNSWGGGGFSQILYDAIEAARAKGILFIAAAGNDNNNNDTRRAYPASYQIDNVVSVAAIDRKGELASFSNYGASSVHLAAPGVEIYSTIPGGYAAWSGTSMATPHVSGVAALLKAAEPNLTYSEIKERMLATSRPLGTLRGKIQTGGVVNAFYALTNQAAPADPEDPFHWTSREESFSTPHPYPSDAEITHTVHVPGATKIAVYFDKFETESRFDTVKFKDAAGKVLGTWSGNQSGRYSPIAEGDTLIIEFKADKSVNKYGFDITAVAYQ